MSTIKELDRIFCSYLQAKWLRKRLDPIRPNQAVQSLVTTLIGSCRGGFNESNAQIFGGTDARVSLILEFACLGSD